MLQSQEAPVRTDKKCRICRTKKPLEEFNLNRAAKDGRRNECAPCQAAAMRAKKAEADWVKLPKLVTKVYGPRNCNRCDREYTGVTRLLCPGCFALASDHGDMDVGLASTGRTPRRAGV